MREREREKQMPIKMNGCNVFLSLLAVQQIKQQFTHIPIWNIIDLMLWHFAVSHFYGHQLKNPIIIIRRRRRRKPQTQTQTHNQYKLIVNLCKVRSVWAPSSLHIAIRIRWNYHRFFQFWINNRNWLLNFTFFENWMSKTHTGKFCKLFRNRFEFLLFKKSTLFVLFRDDFSLFTILTFFNMYSPYSY